MKKLLLFVLLASVLSMNSVLAADVVDAVDLDVTMVNQDPYAAEPQSYVNLLFKLENKGTQRAENVIFELATKFPFSLDPGEDAVKELGVVRGLQTNENAFLIKYKARIDEDALDGENEIEVKYTYDSAAGYYTKTFYVTITDPKTDFDVVLQDSSDTSTTLAIANIGTKTAYSVTVRVPEQENFRVTGISSSIIGNLNEADYTLVTFDIVPNMNIWGTSTEEQTLTVEIFYTDDIGVRRVVQKDVPITGYSGYTVTTDNSNNGQTIRPFGQRSPMTGGQGLTYILVGLIGVGGIAGFFLYRRHKKKKKKQ